MLIRSIYKGTSPSQISEENKKRPVGQPKPTWVLRIWKENQHTNSYTDHRQKGVESSSSERNGNMARKS